MKTIELFTDRSVRDEPIDGNVSNLELDIICSLCFGKCFEFGTFNGRTALAMALSHASIVYTLDLNTKNTRYGLSKADQKYTFKTVEHRNSRIVQLYGDSAMVNLDKFYGEIDFVFVDGSHSYKYVMNDSRRAFDLLKPGGRVMWHDYGTPHWPDVTKALDLMVHEGYDLKWIMGTSLVMYDRS